MGCYIVEALNGMGMHGNIIPPSILRDQMKVSSTLFITEDEVEADG